MRDKGLLILILEFIGYGTLYKYSENTVGIMVYKFKDIEEKIIIFFKKYLMHGVKALDFPPPAPGGRQGGVIDVKSQRWWNKKKHLTAEGLEEIRHIRAGINKV